MKKISILVLSILCLNLSSFSQTEPLPQPPNEKEKVKEKDNDKEKEKEKEKKKVIPLENKRFYGVFESKTLFQIGLLQDSAGGNMGSIVRFAPFANYTVQMHKDITNKFGVYTGVGIKNVGFITKYNAEYTVKSRAYCLSVPLGLKFGNMNKETYFYVAGEFLAKLDYKEKIFDDGDKSKTKNLGDINPINYSGMAGFNIKEFTFGVEYTLNNLYGNNYRLMPEKSNPAFTFGTPTKSNILTIFFGFRANLSAKKAVAPEKKQLQQAKIYQY